MERISTGISELDVKLEGGYPIGKVILVTGASGTGKTIFGLHFLRRSCIDGRKCVHIATEESPEDLLVQAEMLGLDLRPYLDSGQLTVKRVFETRTYNVEQAAEFGFGSKMIDVDILKQVKLVPDDTDVVVIDNMGVFALDLSVKEFRDRIDTINRMLAGKGCTTLFIMDEAAYKLTHEVSEYSAYGSIKLMVKENPYTGVRERYLDIPKMRSTKISLDLAVFDITSEGIKFRKSGSKA
jgi:KaiC/GvpD/RAD55 family RecA-like ATPase